MKPQESISPALVEGQEQQQRLWAQLGEFGFPCHGGNSKEGGGAETPPENCHWSLGPWTNSTGNTDFFWEVPGFDAIKAGISQMSPVP